MDLPAVPAILRTVAAVINVHWVWLGAALSAAGSGQYVWSTIRGRTSPRLMSWLLWALAPMLAFAAQLSAGAGLHALMTFSVGAGPAAVVIAAVLRRRGRWETTGLDRMCLLLSVAGTGLWLATRVGLVAVCAAVIADALAGAPTLRQAWRDPARESPWVFVGAALNATISLLALRHVDPLTALFPAYILLFCGWLAAVIVLRGKRLSSN
jgi:hypothetical protein